MNERQEVAFYDYMNSTVPDDRASQYMDGYACFGWKPDDNRTAEHAMGKTILYFKRDRAILNKTELTRLQRHYEACMNEVEALERSKDSVPTIVSLSFGLVGCVCMAGSVFAVTATPPIIWLCAVLGVPGIVLWILSYFGYKVARQKQMKKVIPLIERKYDEAYDVCAQAGKLLK